MDFSRFYCLDKYETQFQPLLQFSGTPDRQDRQQTEEETLEVASEFEQLLRDKWSKINMVDQFRPSHCCDGQTGKYLFHGFSNLGMTPEQYMFKLTDYSEDNKPLNFISVSTLIIVKIYFTLTDFTGNVWTVYSLEFSSDILYFFVSKIRF